LGSFNGEIAIHFRGLENINEPTLLLFRELVVCLNCGVTEFVVPQRELRLLAKRGGSGAE
jgi:hypothetical protein